MAILSILICTIPSRRKQLDSLLKYLSEQIDKLKLHNKIEIIVNAMPKGSVTIGAKRNTLLEEASGEYVAFIDDDDYVTQDYIKKVYEACNLGYDCVELRSQIASNDHLNGRIIHFAVHNDPEPKLLQEDVYIQSIGHLCPVKASIALKARFPELNVGEDLEYSRRIKPLLRTMAPTEGILYYYNRMQKK